MTRREKNNMYEYCKETNCPYRTIDADMICTCEYCIKEEEQEYSTSLKYEEILKENLKIFKKIKSEKGEN